MSGIAVAGAGAWGRNLVRNYQELGVLRAVCDLDEKALAHARALCPGALATRDYEDVLRDPGVRGVAIALPPALHFAFAERAIAAGKDVCVEKPLALSAGHARILEASARDAGRVLMVGHVLRYHPAFVALKARIGGGRFGAIRRVEATRLDSGLADGTGSLWDLAPHDLSMILSLTGEMPASVACTGSGRIDGGLADISLSFPSGARARVRVSRSHFRKERRFEVVMDGGSLVFEDLRPWERKLEIRAGDGSVEHAPLVPDEPLRAECRHFLECMASRKSPLTDGAEGRRVLEVLERSMEGGITGDTEKSMRSSGRVSVGTA